MLLPAKSQFFTLLCPFFLLTGHFFSDYSSIFLTFGAAIPPLMAHFPLLPLPSVTQVRTLLFCVLFFCLPVTFFCIRFRFFLPQMPHFPSYHIPPLMLHLPSSWLAFLFPLSLTVSFPIFWDV